jgi:hypothetical protein
MARWGGVGTIGTVCVHSIKVHERCMERTWTVHLHVHVGPTGAGQSGLMIPLDEVAPARLVEPEAATCAGQRRTQSLPPFPLSPFGMCPPSPAGSAGRRPTCPFVPPACQSHRPTAAAAAGQGPLLTGIPETHRPVHCRRQRVLRAACYAADFLALLPKGRAQSCAIMAGLRGS